MLSLSLQDIEEHLHIRERYLSSLEAGDIDSLPSPVQARGMLANYAEFLNLNVDALLLAFADALQKKREAQQTLQANRQPAKELSPNALKLKNFFSLDLFALLVLFLVFAGFVIWGISRIFSANASEVASTDLPEVSDVLLATSVPTYDETTTLEATLAETDGAEGTQVEAATPIFTLAAVNAPIGVVIIPYQNAWVQVTSDGDLVYQGRVLTGNVYDYTAEEKLEILTGSAGALQIYFNDQDMGSLGLVGQVSNLVFTTSGLIQPTPTQTPPVTETPQTTPTPTVTPSPTPTQAD